MPSYRSFLCPAGIAVLILPEPHIQKNRTLERTRTEWGYGLFLWFKSVRSRCQRDPAGTLYDSILTIIFNFAILALPLKRRQFSSWCNHSLSSFARGSNRFCWWR